jgi:hypothetical protein
MTFFSRSDLLLKQLHVRSFLPGVVLPERFAVRVIGENEHVAAKDSKLLKF